MVLGAAAVLVLASAARAEDAVVPDEWEEQRAVGACDHLGAGFAKLPGTNTCARIGGQLRFEKRFSKRSSGSGSQIQLDFETRSD